MANNMRNYQKDWDEKWKSIICDDNGNIDIEQVKKELSDYSMLLEAVPTVYCHVTGNQLSKPTYSAETVVAAADEYYQRLYRDMYADDIVNIIDDEDMDYIEKLMAIKEYVAKEEIIK